MGRAFGTGNRSALAALALLSVLAASHVAVLRALALPLLLLVPGAAIRAALLRQPVLAVSAETVALSFVLSLAAVIGCALALGAIGVPLSGASVVVAVDVVALVALARAPVRRTVVRWPAVARASALIALLVLVAVSVVALNRALPGPAADPYLNAYLRTESVALGAGAGTASATVVVAIDNRTRKPVAAVLTAGAGANVSETVAAGGHVEASVPVTLTRAECGQRIGIEVRSLASFSVRVECPA